RVIPACQPRLDEVNDDASSNRWPSTAEFSQSDGGIRRGPAWQPCHPAPPLGARLHRCRSLRPTRSFRRRLLERWTVAVLLCPLGIESGPEPLETLARRWQGIAVDATGRPPRQPELLLRVRRAFPLLHLARRRRRHLGDGRCSRRCECA